MFHHRVRQDLRIFLCRTLRRACLHTGEYENDLTSGTWNESENEHLGTTTQPTLGLTDDARWFERKNIINL